MRRLDYLSTAKGYEKGVWGEEMKRELEGGVFSKSRETPPFHLRGYSVGPVVNNQTAWVLRYLCCCYAVVRPNLCEPQFSCSYTGCDSAL